MIYILHKVFEIFIRNHTSNLIEDNLNFNQHGFLKDKSTLFNILESIDIINASLMQADNVDIIYLDFSKAFDTISHFSLLVKIKKVSISKKNSKHNKYFNKLT